ncbi:glycosyltransferase family 2 protein [Mucilaginibacter psychrotolerans]|uniref:Glycosyltransferase n=1 Tax=Mucilaginibacter psychrotolerans TaxID=1524096 RepID=A0A4Y8SQN4_9SPHI|nr:glycosyltransferase [Mucilaginibacter psychrotolerans]TFF40880.1 glycosyltransferase [Mucilaginibacter psychrotolerans]
MSELAIVIPAYKHQFFDKTLNSLARQTNKNFTVYIGDDNSPFALSEIINRYKGSLRIYYTRFENNIGAENLVLQWNRCVGLTKGENWICLFSDDDIMDENCVENFYLALENKNNDFDVCRFNTVTIDKNDSVLHECPIGPEKESSASMAFYLLKGKRGNSMPDHIFSREIYDKCGGFVFTEFAQGADWATSILFSHDKGIQIIPDAKVYWRYSGLNISSAASSQKHKMIIGHLHFVEWALNHFQYLKTSKSVITYEMIKEALRSNLNMVMVCHYKGFNINSTYRIFTLYHKKFGLSPYQSITALFQIMNIKIPAIDKLIHIFSRIKGKICQVVSS